MGYSHHLHIGILLQLIGEPSPDAGHTDDVHGKGLSALLGLFESRNERLLRFALQVPFIDCLGSLDAETAFRELLRYVGFWIVLPDRMDISPVRPLSVDQIVEVGVGTGKVQLDRNLHRALERSGSFLFAYV